MALIEVLYKYNPSVVGVCRDMLGFMGVMGIAFLFGVTIGWLWKPRWVNSHKLNCFLSNFFDSSFSSPPSRSPTQFEDNCTSSVLELNEEHSNISSLVTEEDLEHLYQLVEKKDGGPAWVSMMDCATQSMAYRAWRRNPKTGPPQYCTSTIFEDASPHMLRDFFWDDEFREKWDDMLSFAATIEECPITGTMIVHWIRKFPFLCGDREYIIARRIWHSEKSYYCVTKGVPCASIPQRNRPRRVDLYYSSWYIRPVESRSGSGQLNACEVLFFHHEEMGIPWEIAKLGVRQGMRGTVKKIESGFRAYQKERASGAALSRSAFMAHISIKVTPELLRVWTGIEGLPDGDATLAPERPLCPIPKLLIFGGVVAALGCSIDKGLLTKTFIFGVARKLANIGKRL